MLSFICVLLLLLLLNLLMQYNTLLSGLLLRMPLEHNGFSFSTSIKLLSVKLLDFPTFLLYHESTSHCIRSQSVLTLSVSVLTRSCEHRLLMSLPLISGTMY